jgi:hypothetical protein
MLFVNLKASYPLPKIVLTPTSNDQTTHIPNSPLIKLISYHPTLYPIDIIAIAY